MRSHLVTITAAVLVTPALVLVTTPAHAAAVRCAGVTATLVGTPGDDDISGTEGDDVIVGRGGRDIILGGGGHDLICGNVGRDRIDGGAGADVVRGAKGLDDLGGGPGNDTLYGGSGMGTRFKADAGDDHYRADPDPSLPRPRVELSFESAPGPVSVDIGAGTASGWGNDTFRFDSPFALYGSAFPDTLVGSDLAESVYGGGGFDTITGRGGGDWLQADEGVLDGGDGDDSLGFNTFPGAGSTLDGGPGNDHAVIHEYKVVPAGELNIDGGNGVDSLTLYWWWWDNSRWYWDDQMDPDSGPAAVAFDLTTGTLDAGDVSGTASNFEDFGAIGLVAFMAPAFDVIGTDGPNRIEIPTDRSVTVHGLAGDDRITTKGGDDALYGGSGDDRLVGEQGSDRLDGGIGDDTADWISATDTCTSIEHQLRLGAAAPSCETLQP